MNNPLSFKDLTGNSYTDDNAIVISHLVTLDVSATNET